MLASELQGTLGRAARFGEIPPGSYFVSFYLKAEVTAERNGARLGHTTSCSATSALHRPRSEFKKQLSKEISTEAREALMLG